MSKTVSNWHSFKCEAGQRPLPQHVVIIGGSIAGLLSGIALRHAGCTVRILEQHGNSRDSHQAGLGLGPSVQAFLAQHERHEGAFSHTVDGLSILKRDQPLSHFTTGRRDLTSWDVLFYRLRSLFDGHRTPYYPHAPRDVATDGMVSYETRKKFVSVTSEGNQVEITVENHESGTLESIKTDLVIAADGPNSLLRRTYLPQTVRQYSGYIIWRGLVSETEISPETLAIIEKSVVSHRSGQQHFVLYLIPGDCGSVQKGERFVNFAWYTNESENDLNEILQDRVDGHVHRYFVPKGRVRDSVWEARLQQIHNMHLPGPLLEIVSKIRSVFIQVVTDHFSARASFEDGKILLIGDALSQFRPHAALGVDQSAFHALALKDYISGKISLRTWEQRVTRYSYLGWALNAWWGDFYQKSILRALPAFMRYNAFKSYYAVCTWWGD